MVSIKFVVLEIIIAINFQLSSQCPQKDATEAKASYKMGELMDNQTPITIQKVKDKLKQSGVFDWQDSTLSAQDKKELKKLFDAVEIMTTSRARQPANVQTMFSSLRLVERAVKKMFKERQISESLVNKFDWDKLNTSDRNKINHE